MNFFLLPAPLRRAAVVGSIVFALASSQRSGAVESAIAPTALTELNQALQTLGAEGVGHDAVIAAIDAVLVDPRLAADWPATLAGLSDADPRAANWRRMLAARQLQIDGRNSKDLPDRLAAYVDDRNNDPAGRYLAYQTLVSEQPDRRGEILDGATDDPSLPLRFLAIDRRLDQLKDEDTLPADVQSSYETLLPLARHPDHVRQVAFELKDLGQDVNLAATLGMFSRYLAVAGFENAEGVGFETVYGPEAEYLKDPLAEINTRQNYSLDSNQVRWQPIATEESMGMMDLNPVYDNQKDSVAYVFARFDLADSVLEDARLTGGTQARLGCINANKVWINGELVLANEVYHSGTNVDQYVGGCDLRGGLNTVLLKICQNDQTQPWAQDWKFQFRLTDQTGKGLPVTITQPEPTNE